MVCNQQPHAPPLELVDQLLQIRHRDWVDSRKRLIQQQVAGTLNTHGQCPGNFAAPPLASGQLISLAVLKFAEVKILD